jgi:N-dimethylarginine dimethylaminohydrolase
MDHQDDAPQFLHAASLGSASLGSARSDTSATGPDSATDRAGAVSAQRNELHARLRELGAELEPLPLTGVSDALFVKERLLWCDSGWGPRALLCKPEGDASHQREWTRELWGRAIRVEPGPSVALAGSDVVWIPGRGALLGVGAGSHRHAANALERFFAAEVRCVSLGDARVARLDQALALLDDGTPLLSRDALEPRVAREIEDWIGAPALAVPLADALEGGLRWIQVGRHVVMGHGAPEVQALLTRRGLVVSTLPLEHVQRLGRGAGCLVARMSVLEPMALLRTA